MKAFKVLVLSVLLVLVAVPFASAQTITWNSSFTVVNLGTADAQVTVTFYGEDGTDYQFTPLVPGATPVTNPFTLGPGGSQIIVMAFVDSQLPNGRYSVVLSADQPIVAIANLAGLEGTSVNYNGSYSGSEDAGQTVLYLPSVVANPFYSQWQSHLSIQNLTNADQDVTVNFYQGSSSIVAFTSTTVPAFTSWHLVVADVAPDGFMGSATVEAAGPLAVVDNQYNQNPAFAGANQVYSGFTGGSLDMYCPGLYDNFIGVWIASMNVQNISATDANITVWYSDGMSETAVVAPNASWMKTYNTGEHAGGYFSAHVESDQLVVAIANANGGINSQTYECAAAGSTEIRTPLTMKRLIGAYNTGVQIQNLDTAQQSVCIEYEGYTSQDTCVDVAAGGTAMFYTPGETYLPEGYSGSARVYSAGPLVGIVNQTNDAPGDATGDFALSFRMFNVGP